MGDTENLGVWEDGLEDVDLQPEYQMGTPEYERVIGNILEDQNRINRQLIQIRTQIDALLAAMSDEEKIELTTTEGNVPYKSAEAKAVEQLKKEMDTLLLEYDELTLEMKRIAS